MKAEIITQKLIFNTFVDQKTQLVDKFNIMKPSKDELVREQIIIAAQGLFKQFGLKKTTMDEIAEACGKAKSTLYHYFKSKEEVFDAVLEKELQNLRMMVNEAVTLQSSLKEKLKSYIITFHQEALNKINVFRILKQEIKNELANSARFANIIEFETSFVTSLLNEGFEKKELTGLEKDDIPWLAEVMVVSFLGIVRYSVEKEGQFDASRLEKVTEVLISRIIT